MTRFLGKVTIIHSALLAKFTTVYKISFCTKSISRLGLISFNDRSSYLRSPAQTRLFISKLARSILSSQNICAIGALHISGASSSSAVLGSASSASCAALLCFRPNFPLHLIASFAVCTSSGSGSGSSSDISSAECFTL